MAVSSNKTSCLRTKPNTCIVKHVYSRFHPFYNSFKQEGEMNTKFARLVYVWIQIVSKQVMFTHFKWLVR